MTGYFAPAPIMGHMSRVTTVFDGP